MLQAKAMSDAGGPVDSAEEMKRKFSDPDLVEKDKKVRAWGESNRDLRELHNSAVEEYVISRNAVLQLGLLHSGLAIAAQAVEKELKCWLLASGVQITDVRRFNHRVSNLAAEVIQVTGDLELPKFSNFFAELERWYNARYPDSYDKASRWARKEILELDELFGHLEFEFPLPQEVSHLKFGGGSWSGDWLSIFVRMFSVYHGQHRTALLYENAYLESRINDIWARFLNDRKNSFFPIATAAEEAAHREITDKIRAEFDAQLQQAFRGCTNESAKDT